jgi:hypothetical protein
LWSHNSYAGWQHLCTVLDAICLMNQMSHHVWTELFYTGPHFILFHLSQAVRLASTRDSEHRVRVRVRHSPLATCQAYRLPRELLSMIATIISSAKTGAPYKLPMTRLLTLVPSTLFIGSEGNASTTSLSSNDAQASTRAN